MTTDDHVSPNEVNRRLDRLEASIDGRFDKLERQLAAAPFVRQDVFAATVLGLDAKIAANTEANRETEERFRWLSRTVAAALIVAAVNALVLIFSLRGP